MTALQVGTNAFCTLAFANAYHAAHPINAAGWDAMESTTRTQWLILACRLMSEGLTWQGIPTDLDQALPFPRASLRKRQGGFFTDTEIPVEVQEANAEFAYQLSLKNTTRDVGLIDRDIRQAAGVQFGGGAIRRVIPSVVVDMVRHLLAPGGSGPGRGPGWVPAIRAIR